MLQKILVLHGPNMNLLGHREPEKYGHITLDSLNDKLATLANRHDIDLAAMQSNAEHELIDWVHASQTDFMVINAGGYTHTSVALRDALLAVATPFIEVHITNIYAREEFRQHSYLSDIAYGVITGFGIQSYELAVQAAIQCLRDK